MKLLQQTSKTLKNALCARFKGFVGRRLGMVDKTEAEAIERSLRANRDRAVIEARKWRDEYNRLVGERVYCNRELFLGNVVQVRILTDGVGDYRDREALLELALCQLKRQAGW